MVNADHYLLFRPVYDNGEAGFTCRKLTPNRGDRGPIESMLEQLEPNLAAITLQEVKNWAESLDFDCVVMTPVLDLGEIWLVACCGDPILSKIEIVTRPTARLITADFSTI